MNHDFFKDYITKDWPKLLSRIEDLKRKKEDGLIESETPKELSKDPSLAKRLGIIVLHHKEEEK